MPLRGNNRPRVGGFGSDFSSSARRSPRPPFEGVVERPNLRITKQPGDLLQGDAPIVEVTQSKTVSQVIEDFAEAGAFLSEVPREGTRAHPELLGDRCCLDLATGKYAEELIFHQTSQSGRRTPLRKQIL